MKQQYTKTKLIRFVAIQFCMAAFLLLTLNEAKAAARFAVATGSWNGSIWATTSGGVAGSAATPTSADDVTINMGVTVTVNVTAACQSLTIGTTANGTPAVINVNSGISFSITNAITIPRGGNNVNTLGVGAGSVTAGSVSFTSGGNAVRHLITISTGTLDVSGNIGQVGSTGSASITFTGAGLVKAGGTFLTTATGTLTTAANCTVEFDAAGAQAINDFSYENVTLSNSGAKTLTGATINGTLSIRGTTTTAGTSPTYGTGAILEYAGSAAQTTSAVEFPNSFPENVTINNASGVTLNAAKTIAKLLTMTSGTLNMANTNLSVGSLTGSSNITHSSGTAGNRTFTIGTDNSSPAAYSGVISNGTATTTILTKSGTGTLTLTGLNTYTGKTTISAGTISINTLQNVSGGSSSLGAPTTVGNGTIDIGATGVLQYTGSGHSSDRVVNLTASGGTINASGTGALTLSGGVSGNTFNLVLTGTGDGTESGVISTTSGTVTKSSTGTWTLSGSNTYTGTTTISAGILKLGATGGGTNTPLGTTTNGTVVSSGGALDLAGFTLGTAEALTINGTGVSTGGALMNSGSAATYSGLITLGSSSRINGGTGTINVSNAGTITGSGFTLTLGGAQGGTLTSILGTVGGGLTVDAGVWILAGVNTYTGATTVTAGTLKLNAAGRIADGSALSVSGTFDMNGFNETVASLAGAGLVTSSSSGSITLTTSGTVSTTFSGVIENGSATSMGLTRSGSGVLTLSGTNTYTGTTTLSGTATIQLGADNVIPDASPITMSGGTLRTGATTGFNESIGVVTLSATSTITLGTGSHTLTIANSSGATWGAFTLNIGSWTGMGGSSGFGTSGKVMVGTGGLIAGQLTKVTFTGYTAGALITASGELVPNATIYYSQTSGAPTTLANWNTNRAGGGGTPANFNLGNIFVIQGSGNGGTTPHTMTTTLAWSVSGTGSAIVIENGGVLVASAGFAVTLATTSTFNIQNGGTYRHQNTSAYGTTIFQGTEVFGATSTVELNNSNTTGPSSVEFGNLTVNFTADPGGNVNLSGAITTINGNLTIQSTNIREFRLTGAASVNMDIGGNLTVSGGTLNMSSGAGVTVVNLAGNFSHTAGTITETKTGSGTFVFDGTGTQTYTSGGTLANTINHSISSGSTVDFGTSVISNGTSGTFTLNSGGKIITANTAGLTSAGATGSVRCTGTRTYNSGASYEFQGSNTGAFTLSTPNTITGTLTFNRSAGVTIDQNFTTSTLVLTAGIVTTGAFAITVDAGGSITGASSTAYINGVLKRVYSAPASLVFPIGKGGNYRPLTFEYTALTGTSTVTVQQTESALTGTLPASINLNNSRTWDISQSGGSAFTYKVTLDGTGDSNTGTVVILKKESGTITDHAATTPNYTNVTGFTTLTGTNNFTLGSNCTITADAGSDQTGASTCGLSTITLAAVSPMFGTGQWSVFSGLGGSFTGGTGNPTNSNLNNADFNGTPGSTYVLQWTLSNGACSSSDQMTVTFNPNPTVADAGLDQTDASTCGLTTVNLSANAPSIGTGAWSVVSGVGGSFSNASSETSTFSGVAGSSYTLRWTISNSPCTASTDDVDVAFNIEPTMSDAGIDQNFCLLTIASLAANTPVVGTGQWSVVSGPSTNLSQFSNINDPTSTFNPDGGLGAYVLEWLITNAPCTSASTVTVTAISGPWIGSVSTDWTDPANWCGGVPNATTDVTLSNGSTFYPEITSGSQVSQSISIASAATLTINGGSLTPGDIDNNGTITVGSGGTLTMGLDQIGGTGDVFINGTFTTSKSSGFSGSLNSAIINTIGSISLGSTSTIDYTAAGSQTITLENYANLSNSGNGNRILSNGTIGISGAFSPGGGNYTIGSSTVEFNGSSPQNVPAPNVSSGSNYNNLTINNSAGASLTGNVTLEDALTLTSGAFTTTGFSFTLRSTASQTARIAPITGGSIIGDVTMQRFVPAGATNWSTIGMPVSGATLVQWNDDIATSGYTGSTYGPGIFNSVYTYDETATGYADDPAAYIAATNSSNTVDPKLGYYVYLDVSGFTMGNKTIDVTGAPLTGPQNMNVSFTSNFTTAEDGWNLISNPYCSAIDWTSPSWTKTNIDDAIYVYDRFADQYVGYLGGFGGFNGGSKIIASSQAFLVHTNNTGPSLIADEGIKVAANASFFKSSSTVAAGVLRLQLDGLNGTYHDETIFRTKSGATSNFDSNYDAYKLYSFNPAAPNISSKLNGTEYVINSIDELTSNFDLPVKVNVNTAGSYTINFKGLANFSNVNCLMFEDKLTNTWVDLHVDSTYTFTSAIDTVAAYCRFVLHFGLDQLVAAMTPSSNTVSLPGNTTVTFANNSTGASYYLWDFGDGSPLDSTASPSHTYLSVGNYTATLTVSNDAGCTSPQSTSTLISVDDVTSVNHMASNENVLITQDGQGLYVNYNFNNVTRMKVSVYDVIGKKIGAVEEHQVQSIGKIQLSNMPVSKGIYTIEVMFNGKKITQKVEL